MADFTYSGSGGVIVSGCATTNQEGIYVVYPIGDAAIRYVVPKARKGVLYAIAIKKILYNGWRPTYTIPVYIDRLNGVWNEEELCSQAEAEALIAEYLDLQVARTLLDQTCNKHQ